MTWLALTALLSHWRRRPVQLLALLGGLMLATALWSGVQALNASARASYAASAALLGQDSRARLVPRPGARVSQAEFVTLRRAGYPVSPVIEGALHGPDGRIEVIGIDPFTTPPRAGLAAFGEGRVDFRAFLGAPGLVLAAPETLAALPESLPPALPAADVPQGVIVTDVTTAARLLGVSGYDHLLIERDLPLGLPPVGDATDLSLIQPESAGDLAGLTRSFHLNLTAFGLLSFAVGLFVVQSAIGLAIEQRRGTLRTLRALGVPVRGVLTAFAAELALLALVAGAVGLVLGYLMAAALLPGVRGTLQGLYGATIAGGLGFDPLWALTGLGMTLAGAALAAAGAFVRVARMPLLSLPAAALRGGRGPVLAQTATGLTLWLVATGFGLWGTGLIAGFACLGALLLGAALLLPPLLRLCLAGLSRIVPRGLWHWAVADTRLQLPGLSLALMALLLALSANVGVGTMVGSFRATFITWLDQRLAADLYVTARSEGEAAEIGAFLANDAGAVSILPVWSVEITMGGQAGDAIAMAPDPLYPATWPLIAALPDAWKRLHAGDGVLVNEQFFRRNSLELGYPVTVSQGWAPALLGVYSDYGNPRPQLVADADTLARHVAAPPVLRMAVVAAPGEGARIADALADRFALPPSNVVRQAEIKALSLSVFERTFLVTSALNALTLAVAGFALWMSLLTLADARLPQVAPVWAAGLAAVPLAGIDLMRNLGLAVLIWLCALPLGTVLAWVLLSVVNVQAFGWKLPMQLFPSDWLRLGTLALGATALASLWPALRLARTGPQALLRVQARDA